MSNHRLSKSKILSGLQCPRKLWLEVHRPELAEEASGTLARMEVGKKVGELAWDLLPGGSLIDLDNGFSAALDETKSLLANENCLPIYEATLSHEGVLIRADLMERNDRGVRLVEVKSSTSVKPHYLQDCAIQQWVIERSGYPVTRIELAHIDPAFVYPGDNKYEGLFHLKNISKEVSLFKDKVPGWASKFKTVLDGDMPWNEVGAHCRDPFLCPFEEYCCPDDGPEYPLSCLPRARAALIEDLHSEGIFDVRDIPEERLTNETHDRIRRVTLKNEPEVAPEFGQYLGKLPYPRYFLDFETIQFAVPLWKGTSPYKQLPFQWSCHVERSAGAIEHEEFLDISGDAPMRDFAETLLAVCGKVGPIFVYSHFEKSIISNLIKFYPDLATNLQAVIERLVDLLPLTRKYYYHPAMKGSWSIKAVLPCVAPDLDYSQLDEVKDGGGAQDAYLEAISPDTGEERVEDLRKKMLEYCKLDTLAMVRLVDFFLK